MRNSITLIILFSLLLLGCKRTQNSGFNTDREIYHPKYSSGFNIEVLEGSTSSVINVTNPWQNAENVVYKFLISRDDDFDKEFGNFQLSKIPERIVCLSSTHIAMLDALGEVDRVVGVSGKLYVSNQRIKEKGEKVRDIGYDGNIDYESLLACAPDLVLLYSINGASSMESRLKELGIPYLYIGDYLEENPLGKSEWIVALAEILGKREKGEKIFNELEKRYNSLKDSVSENIKEKPKVMVNMPYGDSWFMPSSESFIVKMIDDAGGEYVYNKNHGNASLPIDMEEAFKLVNESEFWINVGTVRNLEELKLSIPKFSETNSVISKKVFNNNLKATEGGGNDCYESGIINPDLILRDLIKIFHPDLIQEDFVYYHQLK